MSEDGLQPHLTWLMGNKWMNHFLENTLFSKSIGTEAVFTKTEMNEMFFFFFSQNMLCVQRVLETEAVFTKAGMNNEENITFLQNMNCVVKSIETEAVFAKAGMNNKWSVYFLEK